jgi:hypothetical protein
VLPVGQEASIRRFGSGHTSLPGDLCRRDGTGERDCASLRSLETNLASPMSGYPTTCSIDGKQYVAVATAPSGEANSTLRLTPELRPSTTTQAVVVAVP